MHAFRQRKSYPYQLTSPRTPSNRAPTDALFSGEIPDFGEGGSGLLSAIANMEQPLGERSATTGAQELAEKATILAVDDTPLNLSLIANLLKGRYKIRVANNGDKALRIVRSESPPDLILLDIMMPGMSGHDVCRALKSDPKTRDIPIIFLTTVSTAEDEKKGLGLGAADYITKPISPAILEARVKTHLQIKATADFLRDKNDFLEKEVARRTSEVMVIQDVTIFTIASLAETRDNDTGNHLRCTQFYVKALAEHLKEHPRFCDFLSDRMIDLLFKLAPLHDIGKVGIPDRILLKPGRLDFDEFEIMKTHTTLGHDAILHAENQLGMHVEFLELAKEIAHFHHEKWDGTGYPTGIAGDEIPIAARLMAVADVYDALVSRRVYKEGMPHEKAVEIIRECSGAHFDPDVAGAFLALADEFKAIAGRLAGSDEDMAKEAERLRRVTGKSG